jgi:hypothetical protein
MVAMLYCSDDTRKMIAIEKQHTDSLLEFSTICNEMGRTPPGLMKTTRSIINKWRKQCERSRGFIRFLNGIKSDWDGTKSSIRFVV